jgi:ribosomal protein S25
MKLEQAVHGVAQQIAATKIANGASLEGLTFEALVAELEAKILALAAVHAEVPKAPTSVRKPRAKREKRVATEGAVSFSNLEEVLKVSPRTLADIARTYGVSAGVAKRAIKALGDKVVTGKAEPEPGKKGKRATTYRIEG